MATIAKLEVVGGPTSRSNGRQVATSLAMDTRQLVDVKCPECGKMYTRAMPGSGVEVKCRTCKAVTVVVIVAA